MAELDQNPPTSDHSPPPPPVSQTDPSPLPPFDPSRMIGIIKRKALIKELAALYHEEECLAYCQELLELQKKWEEPFVDKKTPDDTRKEIMKPPKRLRLDKHIVRSEP